MAYKEFLGWSDITSCTSSDDLPTQVVDFVNGIEKFIECPVLWLGERSRAQAAHSYKIKMHSKQQGFVTRVSIIWKPDKMKTSYLIRYPLKYFWGDFYISVFVNTMRFNMFKTAMKRGSTTHCFTQPNSSYRLMIVNCYDDTAKRLYDARKLTPPVVLFQDLFDKVATSLGTCIDTSYSVDMGTNACTMPSRQELESVDGVVWTGSNLSMCQRDRIEISRQINLSNLCFDMGIPQFGSCWGMQLAAVTSGMSCTQNERGREQGLSIPISLSSTGRDHPMFKGKRNRFSSLQSHKDHVTYKAPLPEFSVSVLAGNDWSGVQALSIMADTGGEFWGTQYHTELDLKQISKMTRIHKRALVHNGLFQSADDVEHYADALLSLHLSSSCEESRIRVFSLIPGMAEMNGANTQVQKHQIFRDTMSIVEHPEQQLVESKNWIRHLVAPRLNAIKPQDTNRTRTIVKESDTIHVVPVSGVLGAEINGINLGDLTSIECKEELNDKFDIIQNALLQHQVLFFRAQHQFGPEDHLFLARLFGSVQDTHPAYTHVPGFKEITVLENDRKRPSLIEEWHTDMTFRQSPPLGSILHGLVIPPDGKGDTEFISLSAAYDALSSVTKETLCGLVAEHSFEHGFQDSLNQPGGRERLKDALLQNPPVTHPIVRTHPQSGRKGIFVNRLFTTKVIGLSDQESAELLEYLFTHCEKECFRYMFRWHPHSIAFWDNRITMHRPVNDYWPHLRKLHRITIDGDQPFL